MSLDAELLRHAFLLDDVSVPLIRLDGESPQGGRLACAIGIGAFDGVHTGHVALLSALVAEARACGLAAVAVTFDPDPDCVVGGAPASKLTAPADKLSALAAADVDAVAVVPFTREVAALDHASFFERVLAPALDVRSVHVGEDFRLGAGGEGTVAVLRSWCGARGIQVTGHPLACDGSDPITATRIRALIGAGELATANEELGRPYMLRGTVEAGRGEGTGMGFPTANIRVEKGVQLPADGVYAGYALVGRTAYAAAVNVGLPPTFEREEGSAHMEANLTGFSGDIYGEPVRVLFVERLRPSRRFEDVDELVAEVKRNIAYVQESYGYPMGGCAL